MSIFLTIEITKTTKLLKVSSEGNLKGWKFIFIEKWVWPELTWYWQLMCTIKYNFSSVHTVSQYYSLSILSRRWSTAIQSALDLISIIITSDHLLFFCIILFLTKSFQVKVFVHQYLMKWQMKRKVNTQNARAGSTEYFGDFGPL